MNEDSDIQISLNINSDIKSDNCSNQYATLNVNHMPHVPNHFLLLVVSDIIVNVHRSLLA